MKKILMIAACALVALPAAGQAQQSMTDEERAWFDLIRTDVRAEKAAMVGETLSLTEEQGAAFWPLYQEYEGELKMIWDSHIELIEAYAASYDSMSDEVANTLAEWAMELEIQRIQLLRETFRTMADYEAIGAVTAAHFIQIENRIDMLVNMEIMTDLPMLEPRN
jgi:Spy/CpxP family protein refolding chaperone